jgi:hypothetical protein
MAPSSCAAIILTRQIPKLSEGSNSIESSTGMPSTPRGHGLRHAHAVVPNCDDKPVPAHPSGEGDHSWPRPSKAYFIAFVTSSLMMMPNAEEPAGVQQDPLQLRHHTHRVPVREVIDDFVDKGREIDI